jgi:hypothetical protein
MNIKTVKKNKDLITNEICSYQVTLENSNVELSVPLDEANTDYQNILKWVAEGNTIEEAD